MNKVDVNDILGTAQHLVDRMYQDAHKDDRSAFHIGLLEGRIRELVFMLNEHIDALQDVQKILEKK